MDVRRSGAVLLIAVTACSDGNRGHLEEAVIDVPPAPQAEARAITPKEGSTLARGALLDIYDDPDADPLLLQFEFDNTDLEGQTVLQVDVVVEVTIDSERVEREWEMLVGTAHDGQPAVLRAVER